MNDAILTWEVWQQMRLMFHGLPREVVSARLDIEAGDVVPVWSLKVLCMRNGEPYLEGDRVATRDVRFRVVEIEPDDPADRVADVDFWRDLPAELSSVRRRLARDVDLGCAHDLDNIKRKARDAREWIASTAGAVGRPS